ncbi:MAG: WbqC family protein [bacterium]|nr:WbqC family protein [bacterium]
MPGPVQKTVTIHQPDFLPWLGFFHRWSNSDVLILLDDVQFLRRGWHHRDKIKTVNGAEWLTVPTLKKGKYLQMIHDVRIDNSTDWKRKHLGAIRSAYGGAKHFPHYSRILSDIYDNTYTLLMDFNVELLKMAAEALNISVPYIRASDCRVKTSRNHRLIDLVKKVSGSRYLTGTGSRDYLDEALFEQNNIGVIWQDFRHPVYPQLHGEFVAGLSVIDYLMNREEPKAVGAWKSA